MSAWKLVEAVPDVVAEAPVIQQSKEQGPRDNQSEQRPRNNRPRRNPQHHGRSKQERSYYAFLATQQIDSIFHPDSLCMDTYIRSYMDEEGYVPIALVCTYQNVAYFGCTYEDIVNKLIQVEGKAIYYELDHANDTIRPKSGWEKFRMPNPFGGFGLPKYVKQPYVDYYNYAAAAGAAESTEQATSPNADATTPATTAEVVTPSGGN